MKFSKTPLFAGASQVDITPQMGVQLAGDVGRRRPVEAVRDNLYARILILKHESVITCNVSCDIIGITAECSTPLREEIAGILNTTIEGVMINAQQSHSTPCVGNHAIKELTYIKNYPWLGGGDEAYQIFFYKMVIQGVKEARKQLQEVKLKAGRSMNSQVAFNRRFVMRDGTAANQPAKNEVNDILYCEGPIDSEVGLAVFESTTSKKNIACMIHYTAHPCHGYPQRWVSADWPGLWSQAVGAYFKCPCLMFNGFCGNLITKNYVNLAEHHYDMHSDVASLMRTTNKIIPELKNIDNLPLLCSSEIIKAKMRTLSPEYLAKAKDLLKKHPTPLLTSPDNAEWDWVFAVICLEYYKYAEKHNYTYDVELQAFRIGDFTILGCPAEPYVESQLQIKMNSPAKFLFCAHETNDIFAYIPTKQAMERACNSDNQWKDLSPVIAKLVPETLDIITAKSKSLIKKLYV